uniref:Uncharacterized protein n=1 Tax=Avena sativa TaxID=4498 RepID=A0ACD5YBR2_AVESA
MGIGSSALLALRRQSEDESVVNLVVSSPAPEAPGVSASHAGSRTSPIEVEDLDDEVHDVPASEVSPLRRSQRTRRPAVPVVDEQLRAPRQGYKRRRVAAVPDISQEAGEGSSLQVPPKEPIFICLVCWDNMDEPATTICGHIFCTKCIKQVIQAQNKCPTCRKRLKMSNFHRIYLPDIAD